LYHCNTSTHDKAMI